MTLAVQIGDVVYTGEFDARALKPESIHEGDRGLSPYLSDLVEKTQPLIGRENELNRLIELLCRFSRKNPVLVGDPLGDFTSDCDSCY